MSQQIIDQARVLSELIADSEDLHNLRKFEADLANDPVAQELVGVYQEWQAKEVQARRDGRKLSAEETAQYDSVARQVEKNVIISSYRAAQENFASLMDSVNYLIMKGINGGADTCETGGGCDSCSGCGS